jgi:hypothetical protein
VAYCPCVEPFSSQLFFAFSILTHNLERLTMVPTITMLFAAILAQAVAVQSLTNPLEIESFKFFDSVTGGEICGSEVEREREEKMEQMEQRLIGWHILGKHLRSRISDLTHFLVLQNLWLSKVLRTIPGRTTGYWIQTISTSSMMTIGRSGREISSTLKIWASTRFESMLSIQCRTTAASFALYKKLGSMCLWD